jgi:hypothetical protein
MEGVINEGLTHSRKMVMKSFSIAESSEREAASWRRKPEHRHAQHSRLRRRQDENGPTATKLWPFYFVKLEGDSQPARKYLSVWHASGWGSFRRPSNSAHGFFQRSMAKWPETAFAETSASTIRPRAACGMARCRRTQACDIK